MNRILHIEINIWLALAVFAAAAGLAVVGTVYLVRDVVYSYNIPLPEGLVGKPDFVYGAWPALANADFFAKVKNDFIAQKASFVEADLSSMALRVYQEGAVALEVPIKTKGKEGSWWETPSGLYKAESKEPRHFSSFGKVYTPWNIQFQGNFFLHGWPTYPDGTPVASTYSGGCIRFSDEDAKKIYDMVKVGMPILVFEKDFGNDSFAYDIIPPSVTAQEYLVADLKSNFVLLSKTPAEVRHVAFVPKLMSALVASEFQDIEKSITVSEQSIVPTIHPRLQVGATYTLYDLLFPLLLESSGEAANAIVHPLGDVRAVGLMEAKAQALGMERAVFADAAGVQNGNAASSEDIFQLAKYLYNNRPFLLNISAQKSKKNTYGEPVFTDIVPVHPFIGSSAFFGGMVDVPLDAGASTTDPTNMLAIFEYDFHGEKRPIAVIILGSENAADDAAAMIEYMKKMYQ